MTFCPPNTHYPLILWGKLFLSPPCALISFVPPGKNHEIAMNMRRHARYVSWAYPAYLGCPRHVSRAYLTCLEHPRYVSRAYPAYLGFPSYVSRVYPSYLCGFPRSFSGAHPWSTKRHPIYTWRHFGCSQECWPIYPSQYPTLDFSLFFTWVFITMHSRYAFVIEVLCLVYSLSH